MTTQTSRGGRDLSKIALQVATEASRLVLAGFRQNPTVSYKAGEEQGGQAEGELTWYCDPIDGTVNFMRGQPFFAVSLGVARHGVPFAGAVVAPALRMWWRGSTDDRAFRCEAPCTVSTTADLAHAIVTTGLPLRGRTPNASGQDLIGRLSPHVRDLRRCGSAAIELCMVADGTYDAYFTAALSPWDTVAGAAILLAAGGVFQPWPQAGAAYELGCNTALHAKLGERLSEACLPQA